MVCETRVQGKGAPARIAAALGALAAHPEVDVLVLARGGGSFEDLLPFSDEVVVRAVSACPVPVVSAVGHERDTPLCDLAADMRAATPTAAGSLVVPNLGELRAGLDGSRRRLALAVRALLERDTAQLTRLGERLQAAPRLLLERRRRPSTIWAHACTRCLAARHARPRVRDRPRRGRSLTRRSRRQPRRPPRDRAGFGVTGRNRRGRSPVTDDRSFEELRRSSRTS